jgi:hypothetical protein
MITMSTGGNTTATSRRLIAAGLAAACCLLGSPAIRGQQVVRSIGWQDLQDAGSIWSGTVVAAAEGAPGPSLRVVHAEQAPARLALVTIDQPPIATSRYAVQGMVRYDDVAAGSYLEMWSHFADGAYFSRTLDEDGPMGRLEGSSSWRAFILPFSSGEGAAPPGKLVINLVLSGAGTVEIGPLELVQFTGNGGSGPGVAGVAGAAWWGDRQGALLGAVAGSALGALGALIGWLGSAGRARPLVLGSLRLLAWTGLAVLAFGLLALAGRQPYAVYYPLLLLGALGALLGFALRPTLVRRYEQLELRRMQALDG